MREKRGSGKIKCKNKRKRMTSMQRLARGGTNEREEEAEEQTESETLRETSSSTK